MIGSAPGLAREYPSFEEVRAGWVESDDTLMDQRGSPIQTLRSNAKVRKLGWTELKDVSESLVKAVIASEDHRFLEHHGIDWLAVVEGTKRKLLGESTRGASTLSMQVAAYLNQDLKPHGAIPGKVKHRSWRQKLSQALEAWQLEKLWTKNQILEAYLNVVDFRGELRGIRAAAEGLFGKSPSGLNREESFVLASLLRSPEASQTKLQERACHLARSLSNSYDCNLLTAAIENLRPHSFAPEVDLAPHVGRKLLSHGIKKTTLDGQLQSKVSEILRQNVLSHKSNNMNDAAAVVVENATAKVIAYVGSVGALSQAREVDGVQAKRQAGSTLKPFLYGLAIEDRYLTSSSLLDDSAADINLGGGVIYHPQDFDHEFHGDNVTLAQALGSSLNVPAVRTLKMIGVEKLVSRLTALGFRDLRGEEFYGPSLALGSADISLWDLVNAYRTLAQLGKWSPMTLVAGENPSASKTVMQPGAAFIINHILADSDNRTLTFGLDSPLSLPNWSAVKTGTSKDMRDNWCVGFSERYTVGVWAGNFSGQPMWNVSGVTGAAPAWAQIMLSLPQTRASQVRQPRDVRKVGDYWYLKGTEPVALSSHSHPYTGQITYPVEGMTIAPDPDIPPSQQRLYFESSQANSHLRWNLNGAEVPDVHGEFYISIDHSGIYELKLLSESGVILDEVHFSVRGRL